MNAVIHVTRDVVYLCRFIHNLSSQCTDSVTVTAAETNIVILRSRQFRKVEVCRQAMSNAIVDVAIQWLGRDRVILGGALRLLPPSGGNRDSRRMISAVLVDRVFVCCGNNVSL